MTDEKEPPKPEFTDYVHLRVELPFIDKRFELLFRVHNLEVIRARPSFHEMFMNAARSMRFVHLDLDSQEEPPGEDLN